MNSTTVVADNKKRVTLRLAKPGDRFDVQISQDGRFVLTKLQPVRKRAPVVEPVQTDEGFLMIPRKLDRKSVAAAIRADRDAQ